MAHYIIEDNFFDSHVISRKLYYEAKKVGKKTDLVLEANDKKYPVYVIELFMLLTSKEVPYYLFDMMPGSGTFDGWQFVNDYVKGFDNGIEYFKNEFTLKADTLFSNFAPYINNLHLCYYHKAPDQKNTGWGYWVNSYPFTIDAKTIEQYGFYAGIHYSIELLKQKYPVPFKDFDVCPEPKEGVNNATTAGKGKEQITLNTIFDNDEIKVSIIREAIKDLNIVKASTERTITGFIDGCKDASAFPQISSTDIMKAIFHELGKEFGERNKPRYGEGPYNRSLKKTKKHFGV